MSNDLINRQETYKELIDRIDYLRDKNYELYCEIGDVIQDCIEKIPTSYNIDNVVEDLEENSVMRANTKAFYDNPQNGEYVDEVVLLMRAIEIVKAGGGV